MKFSLTTLLTSIFFVSQSTAGLFGPDNYEECVLEKMKGQIKSMTGTAKRACEKQFPFESKLDYYYFDDVKTSWNIKPGEINYEITDNFGDYNITRILVEFSESSCNEASDKSFTEKKMFKLKGNFAAIQDDNAINYKCARRIMMWGKMKP